MCVFVLGGCALLDVDEQYGNFIPASAAAADQRPLAHEAVQQLVTFYPPARTRLELRQPTPDAFGQALLQLLRERGYALLEFNPVDDPTIEPVTSAGLPLRYVLDGMDGTGTENMYRLTLLVGDQSITRPYLAQDGRFVPAGYWSLFQSAPVIGRPTGVGSR